METGQEYRVVEEPFYLPVGNEVELFSAAYADRLPVMLKGPTGCGKTRFVEYMAWKLSVPLVTVACHEDLFASDLSGRYLLQGEETVWVDGPLTRAVRMGAICYLDEIVEARKDTTVVIHPLADDRREMYLDRKAEVVPAHPDFCLVISYNPGYQSVMKDLKPSTRQRFVAIPFSYAAPEDEARIVQAESGVDAATAARLVALAARIRDMRDQGLAEGASTRLLVYAGRLIIRGVSPAVACKSAMAEPLTDDPALARTMEELIGDFMG
ncbi:MAG: CbbQ/NirQ/NorQ/GpvN family protein [Deltaproteobacteria bacterium]|nr:CbbQ/NirQ/NorQ/GpvN family protein [Deltaproteobacteria bacterium]